MSLNQADINANDFQWNDDHDTNIYQTRAVEVVTWNRARKWGMLEEIKTWKFCVFENTTLKFDERREKPG